jgi:nicotinate phosphoribosyltransferase
MSKDLRISPLFTDFYELTMAAGYFATRIHEPASFSLFIRYHPRRPYFVAAGLAEILDHLETLHFSADDLAYLRGLNLFKEDFFSYLERFRFTGDVFAMPEGSLCFADEPLLEVTAPIIEAQILETYLLNAIGTSTLLATKAARCVQVAGNRPLIDFSLRRTQGADAGMKAARVSYLAGFTATSNVLAAKRFGIPVSGTMAHSFVTAFDREIDAFRAYARLFPSNSIFLIDTYDTLKGARLAATVALEMKERGHGLIGVRLDSGDMVELSKGVRRILDEVGLSEVKIFASSGFDEYKIADVIARGAVIDAFGVGTKVGVSADAPFLDIVYKMVRCGERNIRKLSPGKTTLAGCKQVFRKKDAGGRLLEDILGARDEDCPDGNPLLQEVMQNGRIIRPLPDLQHIRQHLADEMAGLGPTFKNLQTDARYPVRISRKLAALQNPGS